METDLIIGFHSIVEALKNPKRNNFKIVATEDAWAELRKNQSLSKSIINQAELNLLSAHKLQEEAKKEYEKRGFNYSRVPSGIYLLCSGIEVYEGELLNKLLFGKDDLKLFCLDQVTDVHNAGAILRTASFYGVDALILSSKKNFGLSPSFFRIASGAAEYVPIIRTSNLAKTLKKVQDSGVFCLGFSEHSQGVAKNNHENPKTCLIMGSEDKGLSNAVSRSLNNIASLEAQGDIKTLNVSVASAIVMEKYFS